MTPGRVLLSFAMLLGLFNTSPLGAQPKEVVIGVIYPLSGPAALTGLENKVVNEIARDVANGDVDIPLPFYQRLKGMPGLKGAKVRLIFADHQGKPELGQAEAERLITQEKVTALIGCVHSSVTATASQVAERYGVPFMNGESSSPTLTERGFKWFFRTSPHDGHFSQAMFDFIRDFEKKRGIKVKTVGIMHEDTLFGADSAKVQDDLAKRGGYEVVANMAYRSRTTSLDAEVTRLKAANPDVFLPTSYTTDATLYVKTAKTLDYIPKMLIAQNAGWVDPAFVQEMRADIEGHITRSPFALDLQAKKPLIREINELFKKQRTTRAAATSRRRRPAPSPRSPCSWTPSIGPGPPVPRTSARRWWPPTCRPISSSCPGPASVSTRRARTPGCGRSLQQIHKGTYATIYPFDLAAADVVYPLPGYKEKK